MVLRTFERILLCVLISASATIGLAPAAGSSAAQNARAAEAIPYKFDFGSGETAPGYIRILPGTLYTKQLGYGFSSSSGLSAVDRGGGDALRDDFCTGSTPFFFTVDVPEGNYDVTVTLGDRNGPSTTTIKSESRRLMLEKVETVQGSFVTRTFTVNVRNSRLKSGGQVRLKPDEQPKLDWDGHLTLEFSDARPCVCALEITRADNAVTLFLAGDSTVTDQVREPWCSWGQMLPRFFQPGVAIANHAESGEALRSFQAERRREKILDQIRSGDYLFIQFAHNDQKKNGAYAPASTDYKDLLRAFIREARARSAIPVLVTSMHRRRFDAEGRILNTLEDYPEAMRQTAAEESVALIDLNAMSKVFFEALGPEASKRAFVHYPAGSFPEQSKELQDDTHFNAYGAYELARCVVEGIRKSDLGIGRYLLDGLPPFDPSNPDPVDGWSLPASQPAPLFEVPDTAFVFSYFVGNGEDGLHLAWSRESYRWEVLNDGKNCLQPMLGESKLMRDPCLLPGPDGIFHLVWTTSWSGKTIGHASSKDLLHWSAQQALPVMAHEPEALNCWAPEVVYNEKKREYILFWATTIRGKFPETAGTGDKEYNHRIYGTTTRDFQTFTPTLLFFDPGFNVIDATFLRAGDGRLFLVFKDETLNPLRKHLRMIAAAGWEGPFSELSPPFTPEWVEGPSAISIGEEYVVYFDRYRERRYGAVRSRDLKTWEDITPFLSFPADARHGTVIAVPMDVPARLIEASRRVAALPAMVPIGDSAMKVGTRGEVGCGHPKKFPESESARAKAHAH